MFQSPLLRLPLLQVALLAEGVDRNAVSIVVRVVAGMSPSSRRAWIEIQNPCPTQRKTPSPSSRRAWIEMHRSSYGA